MEVPVNNDNRLTPMWINDHTIFDGKHFGDCPRCGEVVKDFQAYCINCGQALKWK